MTKAGKAKPVYRVSDGQLSGNGGNIKIVGNVASRAKFVDDEVAVSGKPQPVYIVTDADLVENGGPFKLRGGEPLKLKTISGEPIRGGDAIPIYDVDPDSPVTVLFHDTFTDANGTALLSHTPDIDTNGLGWFSSVYGPGLSLEIQNNQCMKPVLGTRGREFDPGVVDKQISFTLTTSNSGSALNTFTLAPRFFAGTVYWGWTIKDNGDVELWERNGGIIVRAQSLGLLSASTTYAVTGSVIGNNISFTIADTTLSYTSSFLNTETGMAIIATNGIDQFRLDDLQVTTA